MPYASKHHVAIYLVGNEHYAVLAAQRGHTPQRRRAPLLPHRIVWIAKQHHGRLLMPYQLRKPVEIHAVRAVVAKNERIHSHPASIALDYASERMIHRRLDYHLIARTRKEINTKAQPLFQTGKKSNLAGIHIPAVASAEPDAMLCQKSSGTVV